MPHCSSNQNRALTAFFKCSNSSLDASSTSKAHQGTSKTTYHLQSMDNPFPLKNKNGPSVFVPKAEQHNCTESSVVSGMKVILPSWAILFSSSTKPFPSQSLFNSFIYIPFPPQWLFPNQLILFSTPFYPHNNLYEVDQTERVRDWSKLTQRPSMAEWGYKSGPLASYCETLTTIPLQCIPSKITEPQGQEGFSSRLSGVFQLPLAIGQECVVLGHSFCLLFII